MDRRALRQCPSAFCAKPLNLLSDIGALYVFHARHSQLPYMRCSTSPLYLIIHTELEYVSMPHGRGTANRLFLPYPTLFHFPFCLVSVSHPSCAHLISASLPSRLRLACISSGSCTLRFVCVLCTYKRCIPHLGAILPVTCQFTVADRLVQYRFG